MSKARIACLVSGGGTNLGALIKAQEKGILTSGKIELVISSKADAYALVRAEKAGIKTAISVKKELGSQQAFEAQLKKLLNENNIDLIILAGFMTILSADFTKDFPDRIINVHPALIPSFCGEGYYGLKVHEAALSYGVKVSGATIHFVNEEADAGAIILQGVVNVEKDDTPEILQKRIMENVEWKLLPKAASLFCQDKIEIIDGRAYVNE